MDKQIVVHAWLWRAIESLYLGFKLNGPWQHYQPFFDYMGIELFGKGFILAEVSSEYESLKDQEAKYKIDKIARELHHDLKCILDKVNNFMGKDNINKILSCDFDSFTGAQIVKILEAGYIET